VLVLELVTPARGTAHVAIVDVAGRVVRRWETAVDRAGRVAIAWDGRGAGGARAPSGVYLAVVELAGQRAQRRIVCLR
jgi:flagellar hook assembly protein FlgD